LHCDSLKLDPVSEQLHFEQVVQTAATFGFSHISFDSGVAKFEQVSFLVQQESSLNLGGL